MNRVKFSTAVLLLLACNAQAQQHEYFCKQYVCYIDLDYSKIDYNSSEPDAPKVIHPCFILDSSGWREYNSNDYTPVANQKRFRVYYNGKTRHSVFASSSVRGDSLNILDIRQDRVPVAGKKEYGYHKFEGIKSYPPLLAMDGCRVPDQPGKIKKTGIATHVPVWIELYLEEKAIELKLGRLPYYPLIDTIKNCWQVNDSVYIVQADLNLQLYCILDTVPFNKADEHDWRSIEKISADEAEAYYVLDPSKREQFEIIDSSGNTVLRYDPRYLHVDASGNLKKIWKTRDCFFLHIGNKTIFLNHSLHFIDQLDLDGDGYDELIFRKQGSSYISYLLLTNKFQTLLKHRIIQWQ